MNACINKRFDQKTRLTTGSNAAHDRMATDLNDMFAVAPHTGPERRTFIRLPYKTEARGILSNAREGIVRVQDISRIGLRVDAPCPIAPGAPVALVFGDVYFENEPVSLEGRAIWTRPDGLRHQVGVAFDHAGNQTVAAASEVFYAAVSGLSNRFAARYAPNLRA